MPNIIIDDPSFTGEFAEITYCSPGGGEIYLGYHQLPFTWITDIYVGSGSFIIYYPSIDFTCGTCPPPPTTSTTSTTSTTTTSAPTVCYCYTIKNLGVDILYYGYISCAGADVSGELAPLDGGSSVNVCAQFGTVTFSGAPGEILTDNVICTDQTVCEPSGLCDCITFTNTGTETQFVDWDLCPGVFGIPGFFLPGNSTFKACGSNPRLGDGPPNPNVTWVIGEPCDKTNAYPTCVVPKCYTLTSTVDTPGDSCVVTYYDMYGEFITLNITTTGVTYICAQLGSLVVNCNGTANTVVTGGDVTCTSEYDCEPPVCWCYTVYLVGSDYEFQYTSCEGATIQISLDPSKDPTNVVASFCAQKFSIVPIGGNGSIDIYTDLVLCTDETTCNEITTTTTTIPPCNCWTITNQQAGTSEYTYVDCDKGSTEGPFSITGLGTVVKRCATSVSLTGGSISITNPDGGCVLDGELGWVCPPPVPACLNSNGTFDTDLSGWTQNNPGNWDWTSANGGAAEYNGSDEGGLLCQDILTIGQTYNITFDVFIEPSCITSPLNTTYAYVYAGDTQSVRLESPGWNTVTLTLTCTGNTNFCLQGYSECGTMPYVMFDNVCVTEAPPTTTSTTSTSTTTTSSTTTTTTLANSFIVSYLNHEQGRPSASNGRVMWKQGVGGSWTQLGLQGLTDCSSGPDPLSTAVVPSVVDLYFRVEMNIGVGAFYPVEFYFADTGNGDPIPCSTLPGTSYCEYLYPITSPGTYTVQFVIRSNGGANPSGIVCP